MKVTTINDRQINKGDVGEFRNHVGALFACVVKAVLADGTLRIDYSKRDGERITGAYIHQVDFISDDTAEGREE
jgi:hypothetical protein